ncbi:MAG: hypothetical protein GWN84_13100 [Gammaproteobacteria bacterium]|nr:hypothetical protein [Gammaproteobacteria bacterium]NIR58158.1 hypothetical protein [Gammaproteobacteria bacterium]
MSKKPPEREIALIAREIRNYLATHPDAVDSLEGVVKWWLTRQRYEESTAKVMRALDYLVQQRLISKRVLADGRMVYGLADQDSEQR